MTMDERPPREDRKGVRAICTLSVIAGRKIDFVNVALHELAESQHPVGRRPLEPTEIAKVKRGLSDVVAGLDWRLFVTGSESAARRLKLTTTLQDLDREAIWSEVESRLDDVT
jgi:hypothetical protein